MELRTDKRKHTRPLLSILLLIIFLLPLISACQQNPDPTRRPASKTATATPRNTKSTPTTPKPIRTATAMPRPVSRLDVDVQDLQGVELQFWHIWNGPARDVMASLVEEFNRTNEWGIKVQDVPVSSLDEMHAEVIQSIEDNAPPEIAVAYLYQALSWGQDNLTELDDYVDDPVWGMSEAEQEDFFPIFWEHDRLNDKRLGLPAHRSTQLLYYNTTWAKELGFMKPPTTSAQFRQQACAAAKALQTDDDPENDTAGGWIISNNYAAVLGWLFAFDAQIVNSKATGYQFDTPAVEEAFTFLRELYEQGCAWLPENEFSEPEFADRLGLFATGSLTGIPYQEEAFADVESQDEWIVLPFPSDEDEPGIAVYGPSYFILKSTTEKQLASWLLIKWLLSAENQARLIRASYGFPLGNSILEYPDTSNPPLDQWLEAVDLLPYAQAEPNFHSWGTVRWIVSDVATQLYRWYFTLEQLPATIELLGQTATELHAESQKRDE